MNADNCLLCHKEISDLKMKQIWVPGVQLRKTVR
jgi:hypothetical protein